jgi:hypothetical protein
MKGRQKNEILTDKTRRQDETATKPLIMSCPSAKQVTFQTAENKVSNSSHKQFQILPIVSLMGKAGQDK